jgi:dimeric dUTPase (all-alpha-NTP-PPase superfamily)
MKIDSNIDGNDYIICSSVEDFLASEQHHLNLVSQMTLEDMKVEKRYYRQVISMNRMNIINI